MGGQACVVYGAAEFSRDVDLAVASDSDNLRRLQAALDELQAENIAIPPLNRAYWQPLKARLEQLRRERNR